jgi:SSS family solute:Na+ symporter
MFIKVGPKGWAQDTGLESVFPSVSFLDQMGFTTLITMVIIGLISWKQNKEADDARGFELRRETFKTSSRFNISAFAIMIVLVFLYAFFWK